MSRSFRLLPLFFVLLLALACSEAPVSPDRPGPPDPSPDIVDAGHGTEAPGFYFLPPMADDPSATGTFDADLAPVVTICEGAVTDCESPVAEFTTTSGPGSETVRVVADDEHYIANWNTDAFDLDPELTYRVVVSVMPSGASEALVMGYVDVDLVATAADRNEVDTDAFVPLVDGATLPIKFRIETGIVGWVVVEPSQAEIGVGDTRSFTATLYDLHGNVLTSPSVSWSSDDESVATVDGSGLATGVSAGTAAITAARERVSDSAQLTVTAAAGPILDVNGDGYGDVLASARPIQFSFTRDVYLHGGTSSGLSATGSLTLRSPIFNDFASNGWNLGDLDDDGTDAVAIASRTVNEVFLYDGSGAGLETSPFFTVSGPNAFTHCSDFSGAGSCFGGALASGDVDGDGFTDLVVGAKEYLYLYAGSASGFSTQPSQVVRDPIFSSSPSIYGYGSALAVGDFNGDGYDDVAVGSEQAGGGLNGLVYLYAGSASGLATVPATTLAPGSECQFFCGFGTALAADDFDGDGIDDLTVGAPRAVFRSGTVFYFRGSTSGMATSPTDAVTGSSEFGRTVAALGDFDGDGDPEFAASGTGAKVTILGGGSSGLRVVGSVQGPGAVDLFGELHVQRLVGVGDVDGDGLTDLAISQSQLDPDNDLIREGALWIYHGTSSASGTTPDLKLGASGTFEYGMIEGLGYNPILARSP